MAPSFWCRPCGTRELFPTLPGTDVPGYHIPPLRGWSLVVLPYSFSKNSQAEQEM